VVDRRREQVRVQAQQILAVVEARQDKAMDLAQLILAVDLLK